VTKALQSEAQAASGETPTSRHLVESYLDRIVVSATKVTLTLKSGHPDLEIAWRPIKKRDLSRIEDTSDRPS
jgi:hypothetical protein